VCSSRRRACSSRSAVARGRAVTGWCVETGKTYTHADLYLPHAALVQVAAEHADNPLLQGRGQPGTHDVPLGTRLLRAFHTLNEIPGASLTLPVYDKSAFDGYGDRKAEGAVVQAPIDVILFEGWCLGYRSLPDAEIARRIDSAPPEAACHAYPRASLYAINAELRVWERAWYPWMDAFVQFYPAVQGTYALVYHWRLDAEHKMKASNGGHGMSDEQVRAFVQRCVATASRN